MDRVAWQATVLVQFSCSVMSDSLWPHGLQHTRFPCSTPTPRACSNSCPLSRWCHPTISSSVVPISSTLQFFSASQEKLGMKYMYSGLISFRMEWLDLLAVQGTLKSLLQHHSSSINSLALSFLYSPILTSIHDYWKNHSFDQMDLCWQSNVSAF